MEKYITNHKNSTKFIIGSDRSQKLSKTKVVVDRFHFKSHVDNYCNLNNNPDLISELKDINTSVCEQTNYWFGMYKHILKHMNYEHFHFLIFILCNEYNLDKLIDQKYCKLKEKKNRFI